MPDVYRRYVAIEKGCVEVLKAWIEKNPNDLNAPCSSDQQFAPLAMAVLHDNYLIAKYLLEKGAAVDVISSPQFPRTPLHLAIGRNNDTMIQLLLQYRADTLRFNGEGKSALYYIMEKGNLDAFVLLCAHHEQLDVNSAILDTSFPKLRCLHRATIFNQSHMVSLLISMGADLTATTDNGETALDLARRLNSKEAENALLMCMH